MAGQRRIPRPDGERPALDVKVLSVSYPPNEASLVWQVSSNGSGSARVRISYLLGNMNKSFNYRAIAANDEKTLVLSEYIRIQNLANESFGSTGLWAGFGPRFLKPIGLNETKEMLVEKFAAVPVKKTYTCDPQAHGYLDRPQNKLLVPMHYVLKNDKANHLARRRCNTARSASSRKTVTAARPSSARTGASSPRWTMKCGFMSASPRTWSSAAPSTRTSSGGSPATCSTAKSSSSSRSRISRTRPSCSTSRKTSAPSATSCMATTAATCSGNSGKSTTFGGPDKEKSTFEQLLFHVPLPARGADGKAEKIVHKLHLVLKNEW